MTHNAADQPKNDIDITDYDSITQMIWSVCEDDFVEDMTVSAVARIAHMISDGSNHLIAKARQEGFDMGMNKNELLFSQRQQIADHALLVAKAAVEGAHEQERLLHKAELKEERERAVREFAEKVKEKFTRDYSDFPQTIQEAYFWQEFDNVLSEGGSGKEGE